MVAIGLDGKTNRETVYAAVFCSPLQVGMIAARRTGRIRGRAVVKQGKDD